MNYRLQPFLPSMLTHCLLRFWYRFLFPSCPAQSITARRVCHSCRPLPWNCSSKHGSYPGRTETSLRQQTPRPRLHFWRSSATMDPSLNIRLCEKFLHRYVDPKEVSKEILNLLGWPIRRSSANFPSQLSRHPAAPSHRQPDDWLPSRSSLTACVYV